jgi:hypothetical protein
VSCLHASANICCNACATSEIRVYADLLLVTHTGVSVSIPEYV